ATKADRRTLDESPGQGQVFITPASPSRVENEKWLESRAPETPASIAVFAVTAQRPVWLREKRKSYAFEVSSLGAIGSLARQSEIVVGTRVETFPPIWGL